MRRREFIAGLGGAVAWPLAPHAQQPERVRRIGVLMPYDENEPAVKAFPPALIQALADLGWTDGGNVRMDLRWWGDDINRIPAIAQELVGLQPDIIVTAGTPAITALQRGAKPGDLPVQFPVKYEMAVNLNTAKALGLPVPTALLALADEVIE